MKRMNVREFRAHISELTEETIEVTRYGESVGYWVPHSMTTMPKRPKPKIAFKPTKVVVGGPLASGGRIVPDAVMDDFIKRISTFNAEMDKLGVKKK